MSDEVLPNYRSALKDALGQPIPLEGEMRVWLDDDLIDRRAPDGWVHVRTAREACLLILTGRVIELSLDNDLGDSYCREEDGSISDEEQARHLPGEIEFGLGYQVINFLEELEGGGEQPRWPDKVNVHTANPEARDSMKRAIENLPRRFPLEVEDVASGGKPRFRIRMQEDGAGD